MKYQIEELAQIASELRARIIAHSSRTATPHLGSCLSCVDILTLLYFNILNIDPKNPRDFGRDRFILSKGHGAPALFQVLAKLDFFPKENLDESDHKGSGVFGEHPPTPDHLPGIEAATGSLGHGLPIANGMMLAGQLARNPFRGYVLLGDGECNEGSVWEAAMFAASRKLDKLTVIVDFNKWQATGRSREILHLDPLVDKWRAFGWDACEADGHDIPQLAELLSRQPDIDGRPRAIVAHTTKGKGVSFMEDDNNWHYRIPTQEEVLAAEKELMSL